MSGHELTCEYLEENGFDVPIIVNTADGLDLRVPPPSFTVQQVENYVGVYHSRSCSTLYVSFSLDNRNVNVSINIDRNVK